MIVGMFSQKYIDTGQMIMCVLAMGSLVTAAHVVQPQPDSLRYRKQCVYMFENHSRNSYTSLYCQYQSNLFILCLMSQFCVKGLYFIQIRKYSTKDRNSNKSITTWKRTILIETCKNSSCCHCAGHVLVFPDFLTFWLVYIKTFQISAVVSDFWIPY